MNFEQDPEYELVPPTRVFVKRGRQCGECGMKFDYNAAYGYYCTHINCPMGFGGAISFVGLVGR